MGLKKFILKHKKERSAVLYPCSYAFVPENTTEKDRKLETKKTDKKDFKERTL